jgi:hypothetical protein
MDVLFWIAGIIAALFALDRLLLWMEARGWIYWRKVRRKRSGGGGPFVVGSVFDPTMNYAAEVREERAQEDAEDGDDDGKRAPQDRLAARRKPEE